VIDIQQLVEEIKERANAHPEKLNGLDGVYVFDVRGSHGAIYTFEVANGTLTVRSADSPKADVTFVVADRDLNDMVHGKLSAMMAFMSGKLQVRGDLNKAMKLEKLL